MKEENVHSEVFGPEDAQFENMELFDAEYDDDDDEGFEAFAEYDFDDDERAEIAEYDDDDDESEDAEYFLGAAAPLLGAAAAPLVGGLAGSLAPGLIRGVTRGVSRLLSPGGRRTRRYSKFSRLPGFGGVKGVRIRTPRGSAYLRLPKSVVPMRLYRTDRAKLQTRDNRLNARINRTQKDLTRTDKKAARALAQASAAALQVSSLSKRTRRDIRKLKEKQKSDGTMNLMLSMMQMQNLATQLKDHTHGGVGGAVEGTTEANMMMLLLPLLLMDDGAGDDNTSLLLMMFMMQGMQNKTTP